MEHKHTPMIYENKDIRLFKETRHTRGGQEAVLFVVDSAACGKGHEPLSPGASAAPWALSVSVTSASHSIAL